MSFINTLQDEDSIAVDGLDCDDSQTCIGDTSQVSEENIINDEPIVYPIKNIVLERGFYSIFELKRKFDKETQVLILDSSFQRESVWKIQQKRELIESILMGLPLPIFYFNADKDGNLIVIDGRQRLTALFEFIDNKFKLEKLNILSDFNGKKFNELLPMWQSKIEDYQIMAHIIKPPTPDKVKFDIFDRVNRAGTQLNKQEIRNALYQGNATSLLNEVSNSQAFAKATENAFKNEKRMKDRYLILRFLAFYLYFDKKLVKNGSPYKYNNDLNELLGVTMEYLNQINKYEFEELKKLTIECLDSVYHLLGANAFRLVKYIEDGSIKRFAINITIFECVMYAMSKLQNNTNHLKDLKNKFDDMKNNSEFRDSLRNHRDSIQNVKIRYEFIRNILDEYGVNIGDIYDY